MPSDGEQRGPREQSVASLLFLSQWYIIYFISTGPGSIRFSLSFSVSPPFSLSLLRRGRERFRSVTLLDTDILSYLVRLATAARRDYVCPVFACTMTLESSDKGCTHTKDEWKQCDYEERERETEERLSPMARQPNRDSRPTAANLSRELRQCACRLALRKV